MIEQKTLVGLNGEFLGEYKRLEDPLRFKLPPSVAEPFLKEEDPGKVQIPLGDTGFYELDPNRPRHMTEDKKVSGGIIDKHTGLAPELEVDPKRSLIARGIAMLIGRHTGYKTVLNPPKPSDK